MADTTVRKGMPSPRLSHDEFKERFLKRFFDPAFDAIKTEIDRIAEVAWDGYDKARKSPRTVKAGHEFADPDYELSVEWLETHRALENAQRRHDDPGTLSRILLINGAARSEHTCPGEMSKTWRLLEIARDIIAEAGIECDIIDLSRLASEYGRVIYPCKTCVSTAMPLCHWPCSCYPNHSLGQTGDWMNELYPRWVAAHGVMILCPVNWYQAPSSLKLMIDRLVCADGGNPDPTSTHGKNAAEAKALELKGWPYPRHLAGRTFSVFVHGDAAGAGTLRRSLDDWLEDIGLIPAGHLSHVDRYIGYLEPYATSHGALDADTAVQEDIRNAASALISAVRKARRRDLIPPDEGLKEPRQK
jgi:multimeric flavodoxin WrbA